jgi:hypothetical protein
VDGPVKPSHDVVRLQASNKPKVMTAGFGNIASKTHRNESFLRAFFQKSAAFS